MTNQKNTPEKVAKRLKVSGLFEWVDAVKTIRGEPLKLPQVGYSAEEAPWPTADQSEEILGKMGLQVVWNKGLQAYCIADELGKPIMAPAPENELGEPIMFPEIPKGHRTHANNAGLAYCCENMFNELKEVMECKS